MQPFWIATEQFIIKLLQGILELVFNMDEYVFISREKYSKYTSIHPESLQTSVCCDLNGSIMIIHVQ